MNTPRLILPLILILTLTSCHQMSHRDAGTIIGGIAGGVIGNNFGKGGRAIAVIAGTLVGAYIGGSIGQEMDDNDHYRAQRALETTRTNQSTNWVNPDSGNEYTITPTRTFETRTQGPCRDYTTEVMIDGNLETVLGTACRNADGTWQTVN